MSSSRLRHSLRTAAAAVCVIVLAITAGDALGVGLVAQWSFNESSGTTAADSGPNGLTGTLQNGASFGAGVSGNALVLGGNGQFVDLTGAGGAPSSVASLSQGTVSMWFKFQGNTQPNQIQPIITMGDGIGGNANSSLIVEIGHFAPGDNKLYFTILNDGQKPLQCYDSGVAIEPDKWHNFVVTVGPEGNTGYLDGKEMTDRHYNFATAAGNLFMSTVNKPDALWIGKGPLWHGDPQYFNGSIDEVMIYDTPLCAQQVLDYYNSTIAPPAPIVPEPLTAVMLALAVAPLAFKASRKLAR